MTIQSTVSAILAAHENNNMLSTLSGLSGLSGAYIIKLGNREHVFKFLFSTVGDTPVGEDWIHYWEASSYNEGFYIGQYFEVDDYADLEDFEAARSDWLRAVEVTAIALGLDGGYGEEWFVGDTSGDAREIDMVDYYEMKDFMETSGLDSEAVKAGIALDIPLEELEDKYSGHFESDTDMAWEFMDSTGMLSDVPDHIANYFDMEAFVRDLAMDYSQHNGHYFTNC